MRITGVLGGFVAEVREEKPASLMVGQFRNNHFIFVGLVEIRSSNDVIRHLFSRLKKLEVNEPFFSRPILIQEDVHWVEPQIVVDIDCSAWNIESGFSEPAISCLRMDIPASKVQTKG